jgi:putative transposase
MIAGYKSNNIIIYSSKYHIVFCPKFRRKVLEGRIARPAIFREVAKKYRVEIFAMEIMPDHVHLLVEVHPQFGIHRFVKHTKGISSHHLRKEFPSLVSRIPSLWTNSYFCSTVGGAPLSVIKQYVENQKNV